jgi:hypothetical protein
MRKSRKTHCVLENARRRWSYFEQECAEMRVAVTGKTITHREGKVGNEVRAEMRVAGEEGTERSLAI